MRYQKLIIHFFCLCLLAEASLALPPKPRKKPDRSTALSCSPYQFFDQDSACLSLKDQNPSSFIIRPETVENEKNYKLLVSQFVGAPASVKIAFPELSVTDKDQQNHLDSPAWQHIINKNLSALFSLKNLKNKNYFCKSLPFNPLQLGLQLGVNHTELANKIHRECLTENPQALAGEFGNQVATKFYIFVKLDDSSEANKNFPFTGWTDMANNTYLFIRPSTTWGDLGLAITHEVAIGMDSKNQTGMYQLFSSSPQIKMEAEMQKEWKQLFTLSLLPEIQYAFTTMRANRIMKIAFEDVKQKKLLSANNSLPDRAAILEEFKYFVKQAQSWKLPTIIENPINKEQQDRIRRIKIIYPHLEEVIQLIEKSKTKVLISPEEEVDFLTYMSTPVFGEKSVQTFKSNGPGCGYCGGSYKQKEIEEWNSFWEEEVLPENLLRKKIIMENQPHEENPLQRRTR